jgi:hypothetical protein
MLERHVKIHHPKSYADHHYALRAAKNITRMNNNSSTQSSTNPFLVAYPEFESCLLNWMIKTYQPVQVSECDEFRLLCKSLNKRSHVIGCD